MCIITSCNSYWHTVPESKWPVKPQLITTCLPCPVQDTCGRCSFYTFTSLSSFTLFPKHVDTYIMSPCPCLLGFMQLVLWFLQVKLKEPMKEEKETYWQETGRWVGYEESFDPQAGVWASSHISFLTFKSLIQIRRSLNTGKQWVCVKLSIIVLLL